MEASFEPGLAGLSTCQISDALISLGIPSGGFIPDIRPVSLSQEKIAGQAYTVKFVAAANTEAPALRGHFLDHAPKGSVVFIEAPPEAKNAVWGGLMSAAAKARGVSGVVVSGRCRDVSEHRSLQFPVFARGNSTVGQKPFTRSSEVNCRLTVEAYAVDMWRVRSRDGGYDAEFPSVMIEPGDEIVADEDGVVCVPKDLVARVVEVAVKAEEIDKRCMEDILKGRSVQETFKDHRGK